MAESVVILTREFAIKQFSPPTDMPYGPLQATLASKIVIPLSVSGKKKIMPANNNRTIPLDVNNLFRVFLISKNEIINEIIIPPPKPYGNGNTMDIGSQPSKNPDIIEREMSCIPFFRLGFSGVEVGVGCGLSEFVGEPHFPQNLPVELS